MTIGESVEIALFCFSMIFVVLSALCLLIKLFSFLIDCAAKSGRGKNKSGTLATCGTVSAKAEEGRGASNNGINATREKKT